MAQRALPSPQVLPSPIRAALLAGLRLWFTENTFSAHNHLGGTGIAAAERQATSQVSARLAVVAALGEMEVGAQGGAPGLVGRRLGLGLAVGGGAGPDTSRGTALRA